eukprot:GHVU01017318.1.p1 GENE.GHVU01017318.1~~GHVU01017318.1.p1  ORF type:complete len:268 (+),score=54.10 GHVU01017318.1:2-805(+)
MTKSPPLESSSSSTSSSSSFSPSSSSSSSSFSARSALDDGRRSIALVVGDGLYTQHDWTIIPAAAGPPSEANSAATAPNKVARRRGLEGEQLEEAATGEHRDDRNGVDGDHRMAVVVFDSGSTLGLRGPIDPFQRFRLRHLLQLGFDVVWVCCREWDEYIAAHDDILMPREADDDQETEGDEDEEEQRKLFLLSQPESRLLLPGAGGVDVPSFAASEYLQMCTFRSPYPQAVSCCPSLSPSEGVSTPAAAATVKNRSTVVDHLFRFV